MTDEERAACDLVERLLRDLDVCELRPWRKPWYRSDDGVEVDTSLYLRIDSEPIEVAALGLAAAIERARAARSKP